MQIKLGLMNTVYPTQQPINQGPNEGVLQEDLPRGTLRYKPGVLRLNDFQGPRGFVNQARGLVRDLVPLRNQAAEKYDQYHRQLTTSTRQARVHFTVASNFVRERQELYNHAINMLISAFGVRESYEYKQRDSTNPQAAWEHSKNMLSILESSRVSIDDPDTWINAQPLLEGTGNDKSPIDLLQKSYALFGQVLRFCERG